MIHAPEPELPARMSKRVEVVEPLETEHDSGYGASRDFAMLPEQVVVRIYDLIKRGELRPGDRLPPEREFALQLGINRTSLRSGLRSLIAMGVLHVRHGSGTFMSEAPSSFGGEALRMLAALHGFTQDEVFEARRHLEALVAGLAAERANSEHFATMAEELAYTYSCADDPEQFLVHDIRFHRALAAASGNPILATLVGMVSAMHYDLRSKTVRKAKSLREAADMHQKIFRAIRTRNIDAARDAMHAHILQAQSNYRLESKAAGPSRNSFQITESQHKNRLRGSRKDGTSKSKPSI
jgi:GntR family transcriptional repressor for pyruvate dehydrogenase complex